MSVIQILIISLCIADCFTLSVYELWQQENASDEKTQETEVRGLVRRLLGTTQPLTLAIQ